MFLAVMGPSPHGRLITAVVALALALVLTPVVVRPDKEMWEKSSRRR
jgi:hypothetical protein